MTTEIQAYSPTEAALAELRTQYKGVIFDCAKPKDMKDAKIARTSIVKARTTLEKARVKTKSEALKYCQLVDSEAGRIKKEILALEGPITQQIKKEEGRKAEIKAKKLREEQEIIQKFRAKIEAIKRRPLDFINATPDQILAALIRARDLTSDDFPAELQDDAFSALAGAIKKLEEMHIAALDAADRNTRLVQAETAVVTDTLSPDPLVNADEPYVGDDAAEPEVTEAPVYRASLGPVREPDPFTSKGPDSAASKPADRLFNAASAACQYLEADPNSRKHIVTRNLRTAIDSLS